VALRRLTGVDSAFLAVERPGNYVHMMGLLVLDPSTIPGGYSFEGFRDFLASRLHALPPLRRRLLEVPGGLARPFWADVPPVDVDLDSHLHRAALPSPGGPREVATLAAEMLEQPLDRSRPLWEMVLVEGLDGDRVALLAKIHHAVMDGMAGVKLMASLFGTTPEIAAPPRAAPGATDPLPGRLELLAGAVPWLARQPLRAARAGAQSARAALRRALPGGAAPEAPEVRVPRSWMNVPVSPFRSVAYTSLPLADLRSAGRALDATLNDALLAVVGGALRRYLGERNQLPAESLAAGVPLAIREEDDDRANAVTSVLVGLGTDEPNPATRLQAIHDAMVTQRRRRRSTLGEELSAWADVPPPFVFSLMTRAYVDLDLEARVDPLCNLIVSSVPGPPEPLYLAGARLDGIYPLGPIYSGVALNVTAMGCGDDMEIGLVACRKRMPDLWDLADGIPVALAELAEAVATGSCSVGAAQGRR
jgi:diacylglycerol O-acyltransferase